MTAIDLGLPSAQPKKTRKEIHAEVRRKLHRRIQRRAKRAAASGGAMALSSFDSPRLGVTFGGSSASIIDAHGAIVDSLDGVRCDTRDASLNLGPYQAIERTFVDAVVGDTGLLPKSQVKHSQVGVTESVARAWDEAVDDLFEQSKDEADVTGRTNWAGLNELAYRSAFSGGDVFPSYPMTERDGSLMPRINLIEAERVMTPLREFQNPRVSMGVQLGKWGDPTGYFVSREHPGARLVKEKNRHKIELWRRRVRLSTGGDRLNIRQLMHQTRVGQPRGIPFLASVLDDLEKTGSYFGTTLDSAELQAQMSLWISTLNPEAMADAVAGEEREAFYDDLEADTRGGINFLNAGDQVQSEGQKQPGPYFDDFVVRLLRMACAARGAPYTIAFLDTKGSNFSSQRAESITFDATVKAQRRLLKPMCADWRQHLIHQAWLDGRLPALDFERNIAGWCRALWVGPRRQHTDPTKEIAAYVLAIKNGLMSRTEVVESLGGDRELLDVFLELENEQGEADKRGITITDAVAAAPDGGDGAPEGGDDEGDDDPVDEDEDEDDTNDDDEPKDEAEDEGGDE